MKCPKCKRNAKTLYWQFQYKLALNASEYEDGSIDIDDGGYTSLDDFFKNMLPIDSPKKRKMIGCNNCFNEL